jgi:hypothetical protein
VQGARTDEEGRGEGGERGGKKRKGTCRRVRRAPTEEEGRGRRRRARRKKGKEEGGTHT